VLSCIFLKNGWLKHQRFDNGGVRAICEISLSTLLRRWYVEIVKGCTSIGTQRLRFGGVRNHLEDEYRRIIGFGSKKNRIWCFE
jgi:hypothetical protein